MRVLQLIDSLRPGGAEQMAVAYANALARRGVESYLCCTRMEGILEKKLEPHVGYLFLGKKYTLDCGAFRRLRDYVKVHGIQIIQAHSSSYFLAVLVKWAVPRVKIIWHDHYGRGLREREKMSLHLMSRYFDGVISVSEALKSWSKQNLKARNVVYIKNFLTDSQPSFDRLRITGSTTQLMGKHKTKIICVANLRPQKDHFNLLKAFELVLEEYPDVSLHLVGKDEENNYSKELKSFILSQGIQENVFLYGEQEIVERMVKQATIGVLSSSSEGLPVALLEYGRTGIPVVCTAVGEVPSVIGSYGELVKSEDPKALAEGIKFYIKNERISKQDATLFNKKVMEEFSEDAIISKGLEFYKLIISKE